VSRVTGRTASQAREDAMPDEISSLQGAFAVDPNMRDATPRDPNQPRPRKHPPKPAAPAEPEKPAADDDPPRIGGKLNVSA